jgi:hypothetical protein
MNGEPRVIPVGAELPPMDSADRLPRQTRRLDAMASAKPKRTPGQRRDAVRRRFGMLNAMIDRTLPDLGRTELAAWLLLYRHAKPDGTVTASVADLARRAGCGERAMRYALRRLFSAGRIDRLKRGTLAGGPSVWRLLTP